MIRCLMSAIPTRQVAESFVCDAVLFWVVAYFQNAIEPAWLIRVMQCMIGFDMLLTLARAYKRQANLVPGAAGQITAGR